MRAIKTEDIPHIRVEDGQISLVFPPDQSVVDSLNVVLAMCETLAKTRESLGLDLLKRLMK